MIRFAAATITLIILMGSFAFAQETTPKVQLFGGYSLLRADHGKLTGALLDLDLRQSSNPFAVQTYFFNGWNAEAQYNAGRWLGIAADVGGRSATPITEARGSTLAGLPKETAYSFLAGPVISYRTKSRVTPFVHALFGWDRTSLRCEYDHRQRDVSGICRPPQRTTISRWLWEAESIAGSRGTSRFG